MREILFKAKRRDNGQWIEGNYGFFKSVNGDEKRHHITTEYGKAFRVDENTICQYTGLTDKNGNKIWENDIVKCNYNDYGDKGTYIGKVFFREDTSMFLVTDMKSTNYEWWNESKEVMGNVFDNQELLDDTIK